MEKLEMVEKIAGRAGLTVEEAKTLLEKNNWDMLDTMVELEREGRITGGAQTSTKTQDPEYMTVVPTVAGDEKIRARSRRLRGFLKKAFHAVVSNQFVIHRNDGELARVPVIVPVLCALTNVVLTAVVLIAGMAFGLRYSLEGSELGSQSVNDSMRKAGEYAQKVVHYFTADTDAESESGNKETQNP